MTVRGGKLLGGRRAIALVGIVVAMGASAQQVMPASASVTSALAFTGTATLPSFPCGPACTGGTFSGTATGVLVTTSATGDAVFVNATMTSSFGYNESCPVAVPAAPLLGSASGTFTISSPAATASGNFSWTRVGLTAVVVDSGVTVTYPNGTTAAAVAPSPTVAVFVPGMPAGTCTAPVTNQTATVVGVGASAA